MRTTSLLGLLLPLTMLAQTTFAPIGAKWTYTQHYVFGPDSSLFIVESTGDTIIQGRQCATLEHSLGISECMGFRRFVTTSGDSMIFWDPIDSTFRALCVFGLSPGEGWETIVGRGYWDLGNWIVVHDTLHFEVATSDMVVIDGVQLRRSTVSTNWSAPMLNVPIGGTVIERLGHSVFLFPWSNGACDFEYNDPLRCYEDPEITWINPSFPQCDLSVGMPGMTTMDRFGIPSVVRQGEEIPIAGADGRPVQVDVFDVSGRRSEDRSFRNGNVLVFRMTGIHLVRISNDDGPGTVHRVIVE